jgi:hypothetical protein
MELDLVFPGVQQWIVMSHPNRASFLATQSLSNFGKLNIFLVPSASGQRDLHAQVCIIKDIGSKIIIFFGYSSI